MAARAAVPVQWDAWVDAGFSTNKSVLGYRGEHSDRKAATWRPHLSDRDSAFHHFFSRPLTPPIPQQSNVVKGVIGTATPSSARGTGLGQGENGHDVCALQKVDGPDEPVLRHARRLRRHHGQYRRRQPRRVRDTLEHSIWYESPKFGNIFSFDVLFSPGAESNLR